MKQVKLLQDRPEAGLVKGDIVSYDELSAASVIERKIAEEYDPSKDADGDGVDDATEAPTYGGQKAATIDDIVDPGVARQKGVMSFSVVADSDPGPHKSPGVTAAEAVAEAESADVANVPVADDKPAAKSAKGKASSGGGKSAEVASTANVAGADAGGGDGI